MDLNFIFKLIHPVIPSTFLVVEEDWKKDEDRSIKSSLSLNVGDQRFDN